MEWLKNLLHKAIMLFENHKSEPVLLKVKVKNWKKY